MSCSQEMPSCAWVAIVLVRSDLDLSNLHRRHRSRMSVEPDNDDAIAAARPVETRK